MKFLIMTAALHEFKDAQQFYELEQAGLGARFQKEVHHTFQRIKDFPTIWPFETRSVQRCFVHTFPYKILYSIEDETILVLALAHLHRKPDYWIDRTGTM